MLRISRNALSKATKHGLNVFPLEAFGLLIGSAEDNCIYAALPVGKTEHWYAINERYQGIENGLIKGREFARSCSMDILGVYHSCYDSFDTSPIDNPPEILKGMYILIKYCDGGESIFGENVYIWNGNWEAIDYKIFNQQNVSKKLNPRRILSAWLKIWGEINYDNKNKK